MRALSRSAALLLLSIVAAWFAACAPASAQSRVALVVGNSAYRNVPVLTNPVNDASDVATSLDHLGFSVTVLKDASFDDLRRALISFGRVARGADMALIYFAGHGMEVGGENWLIPVDAELRADTDTENEAVGLKSLVLAVSGARTIGLVVLDACRNNPFDAKMQHSNRTRAVSRGLAPLEPSDNVLVAFAARDGTTASDGEGRNSPFTAALLKHIDTPGLEINFLFRNVRDDVLAATDHQQQPFIYGSLSREAVYLRPPETAAQSGGPARETPGADEVAWSFLGDVADVTLLRRFANQFPSSQHRAEAEQRIVTLQANTVPPGQPVTAGQPAAAAQPAPASAPVAADAAAKPEQQALARRFDGDTPQVEAAWSVVKTSSDPSVLRRFVAEFPNEQRKTIVKALGGAPGTTGVLRQLRGEQMRAVLSDYGKFVRHPRYGDVWVPSVTPMGWHPYEPCHWVNSKRLGWFYLDTTPWGAIVHHYGRWTHDAEMGWIWVPGIDFSPGWVAWRTSPQKIGWAPLPPVEDVRVISAAQFDNADFWTFMDVATFGHGCDARAVAPAAAVVPLLRTTTYVHDVRVVSGITVVVLPTYVVGAPVDIDVVFDPWPAWVLSQMLVDWNWIWNSASVAAFCPPVPAAAPALMRSAPVKVLPLPVPTVVKHKAKPIQAPVKPAAPIVVEHRPPAPPPYHPPPRRRRPPGPVYDPEPPVDENPDPPVRQPPTYIPPLGGLRFLPIPGMMGPGMGGRRPSSPMMPFPSRGGGYGG